MENRILNRYSRLESTKRSVPPPPTPTRRTPEPPSDPDTNNEPSSPHVNRNIQRPVLSIFTFGNYIITWAISFVTLLIILFVSRFGGLSLKTIECSISGIFAQPTLFFCAWGLLFLILWIIHAVCLIIERQTSVAHKAYGSPSLSAQLIFTGLLDFSTSLLVFGFVYLIWQ